MRTDELSKEAQRRLKLISMFHARLIREFGETTRTINVPQDPTCATSAKGFMLIPHPCLGDVHLKVDLSEAFGVYCLEVKNVELAEIPDAMRMDPLVGDLGLGDEESEAMLSAAEKDAVEYEQRRFKNYEVRWQDHEEAVMDIDTLLFEVMEWILTEPYVKYQKKPFTFLQAIHAEYCS